MIVGKENLVVGGNTSPKGGCGKHLGYGLRDFWAGQLGLWRKILSSGSNCCWKCDFEEETEGKMPSFFLASSLLFLSVSDYFLLFTGHSHYLNW